MNGVYVDFYYDNIGSIADQCYRTLSGSTYSAALPLETFFHESETLTLTDGTTTVSSDDNINWITDDDVVEALNTSIVVVEDSGVYSYVDPSGTTTSGTFDVITATSTSVAFGSLSFANGSFHHFSSMAVSCRKRTKDAGYWAVNVYGNNFIGMIAEFYCTSIPSGWIQCTGQTINATNNPRLYRRLVTEQGMSATLPTIDSTRGTNYKVCIFAGE